MKEKISAFTFATVLPIIGYGGNFACASSCGACQGACWPGMVLGLTLVSKVIYKKIKEQVLKGKRVC